MDISKSRSDLARSIRVNVARQALAPSRPRSDASSPCRKNSGVVPDGPAGVSARAFERHRYFRRFTWTRAISIAWIRAIRFSNVTKRVIFIARNEEELSATSPIDERGVDLARS